MLPFHLATGSVSMGDAKHLLSDAQLPVVVTLHAVPTLFTYGSVYSVLPAVTLVLCADCIYVVHVSSACTNFQSCMRTCACTLCLYQFPIMHAYLELVLNLCFACV